MTPPVLKFQLQTVAGEKLESRHIVAPELETFATVTAAVERLFELAPETYTLTWTDAEGDEVVVRSDDEVRAAREAAQVTTFHVRQKYAVVEPNLSIGADYERRRFGDKLIVDGTLHCDDGTQTKGRWLSRDLFVAVYAPATPRVPGEPHAVAGTFVARFDALGARTAFVEACEVDDEAAERFNRWDRREPWTWSDDRRKKHARALPAPRPSPSPGTLVELTDLVASDRFNGAKGVVQLNRPDGRAVVALLPPNDGATLAVKPTNLRAIRPENLDRQALLGTLAADSRSDDLGIEDIRAIFRAQKQQTIPLCNNGIAVAFFVPLPDELFPTEALQF